VEEAAGETTTGGGAGERLRDGVVGRLAAQRRRHGAAPPDEAHARNLRLACRGAHAGRLEVEGVQREERRAHGGRRGEVAEVALDVALLDELDAVVERLCARLVASTAASKHGFE